MVFHEMIGEHVEYDAPCHCGSNVVEDQIIADELALFWPSCRRARYQLESSKIEHESPCTGGRVLLLTAILTVQYNR